MKIALILLAGGLSRRMGGAFSKAFYVHRGKSIAQYSLDVFAQIPEIGQMIVVCANSHQTHVTAQVEYALPGTERFLSLENGLKLVDPSHKFALIHDAARPLIHLQDIKRLIELGVNSEGAALGAPLRSTIAKVNDTLAINAIVDRSCLWETLTPQFAPIDLLLEGIFLCKHTGKIPTDEMTLLTELGKTPRLVKSTSPNLKITYPSDLSIVCALLDQMTSEAHEI